MKRHYVRGEMWSVQVAKSMTFIVCPSTFILRYFLFITFYKVED